MGGLILSLEKKVSSNIVECLACCVLCFLLTLQPTVAFHSGAPVEACDSMLPRHLRTSPKPATESPYTFTASAGRFFPDSKRRKIKVRIRDAPFRGFFVVALDADTHERIGTFLDAKGMESVPCSAITHTDGRPKVMATMLWQPPENRKRGEVLFLATILESFSSYYSGVVASIPRTRTKKRDQRKNTETPPGPELNPPVNATAESIVK